MRYLATTEFSEQAASLPATIDRKDGYGARRQHVLGFPRLTEGEDRLVLHHPQLIGGGFGALVGEALHRTPHRLVSLAPQVAHLYCRYSVHLIAGWLRKRAYAAS